MSARRKVWLSLESKVMAAVIVVLVALPAITLWVVDRQVTRQIRIDAAQSASTARESFLTVLKVRADELALRFRNIAETNPGFLRILRLADAQTMRESLRHDVLGEFRDTDVVAFITRDQQVWGAHRENTPLTPEALAAGSDPFIRSAAQGEERAGFVAIRGQIYRVVAVPVQPPEGIAGVMVFGIPIGDETLRRIKPPASEIVLFAGGKVVASSFLHPESLRDELPSLTAEAASQHANLSFVSVGGERFQPVAGMLDDSGVRYVLLSSSEQRLATLERTKLSILALSVGSIIVCAAVVWFFVRRITRPLLDLRQSTEAVGQGDFSRRISQLSNDEFGDLAQAFNQMTANLQTSRAELERAMQQVKTTQLQLIQSEKLSAVGQFVAGVAHELNNPLTTVVGFSELLQEMPADEKSRDFLDKIAKSAHRCHKIVQSLLSFARQHPPERKQVNLHAIVDEVLEIMAYDLRTSNIRIVREFAPALPPIVGDPHQLQQVFVNILSNARQAMEPVQREGQIVIRTGQTGSRITISFRDNGPGIRPDHLARIFDPFFTTKPIGKGTGLGLSLCYGIIQEHGGTITAQSEVGHGAAFIIDLPADVAARPSTVVPDAQPAAAPRLVASGKSVLVIDDEAWILELAAELLRAEGHAVETAAGGQQALDLLSRRKFDVIVSDWKMPGLNGVHLYEHLKATDPTTAARVLFMTGDVVSDSFQTFLETHRLTCLSKPFATGEFRAAVAKTFGKT